MFKGEKPPAASVVIPVYCLGAESTEFNMNSCYTRVHLHILWFNKST